MHRTGTKMVGRVYFLLNYEQFKSLLYILNLKIYLYFYKNYRRFREILERYGYFKTLRSQTCETAQITALIFSLYFREQC